MALPKQIAAQAAAFAQRWKGRGYERGESQPFWIDLLTSVFGIDTPTNGFIIFEEHRMVDSSNFIDARIPSTGVLIEQKSLGKDLRKGIVQSDGSVLTPFQQARRYVVEMPCSEHPRWIVTCNFSEFLVYDMEHPSSEPEQILLENLEKEYYRLMFLADTKSEHLSKEMQVSIQAGEIIGRIYDALLRQYDDTSAQALRWLNILCVRIVFCLYAEDAGIFSHDQFHDYLSQFDAPGMRMGLLQLFDTLNKPADRRSRFLREDLKAFPYTNGGLFEEDIEIPQFTDELRHTLLQNASLDFDWSEISPTIFGAVFESTLNPETRRSGGMHYTSIENIHKVIDPLFLNDLRHELDEILEIKIERQRQRKLDAFQQQLASLTFLDPACGSGNFLTETYLSLRRLENEVIFQRWHGQTKMGVYDNPVKVSIRQFHGIEINDFAVTVATTALWISEAQMLAETERIIKQNIDFLPLKSYANIREGNALRMDWHINTPDSSPKLGEVAQSDGGVCTTVTTHAPALTGTPSNLEGELADHGTSMAATTPYSSPKLGEVAQSDGGVCTKDLPDYIIGNPPFVGARLMSEAQKQDVLHVFGEKWKNVGNLDYVSCWYKKAAELMAVNPRISAALVSTNSICQGEQVANLWQSLFDGGIKINFAHRTFRWDSEASLKAHVHCIIVGFSKERPSASALRTIYDNDKIIQAQNINAYLKDAPNIFIESRSSSLCGIPQMCKGSQPTDGGNLLLSSAERNQIIADSPSASKFIRPFVGADEFINGKERYCMWLVDANPSDIRQSSEVLRRINAVRENRLASPKAATRKWADYPTLFTENRQPAETYIIVPSVSSEKRRYVPMGFMSPEVIASNLVLIIPDATLYHFGILESNVHMAWMRAVCGRLKSDYRYSKDIVYNNFPWPKPTEEQKRKIEQTAQGIMDARAKYPDSSLADLYDELTMPVELRKAHQENDRAVMLAYGFPVKSTFTESQCVTELFRLYQEMTR